MDVLCGGHGSSRVARGERRSGCPRNDHLDDIWHYHILDTIAHHEDCDRVFGRYMHHYPYFGMRGEQDADDLKRSFQKKMALYERQFGEPIAGEDLSSTSGSVSAVSPFDARSVSRFSTTTHSFLDFPAHACFECNCRDSLHRASADNDDANRLFCNPLFSNASARFLAGRDRNARICR